MKNIYFKLTTVPATTDSNSKEFELFYDKYKEAKNLGSYDEAFKTYLIESAKNPLFGRIYSIAVSFVAPETESVRVKLLKGDEKYILQEFINILNSEYFKGYKPTMWNAEFILPFLSTRAAKNNLAADSIPNSLKHYGLKPWSLQCTDLQSYIKGVGYYIMSLEETAFIYNLPTDFIDASDIYSLWSTEQFDTIDSSSVDEVKTIVNIHRLISGESALEELNLDVVVLEQQPEIKELPILEKLYNTGQFTEPHMQELKAKLKGITEEEKPHVIKLILAHYLQKKDKAAEKKRKTEEITNYINSL